MSHDSQTIREVSMALRRLVLAWDRYRESIAAELDVGTTEVVALGFLFHEGSLTPRELGERLNLTSGSVTALLDRLESSGFVSRAQNPDDRRSLLASATPAGKHAVQWFYERLDEVIGQGLERVPRLVPDMLIEFADVTGEVLLAQAREAEG